MRILVVEDERAMLERLVECIAQVMPEAEICAFRIPSEGLQFARENPVDLAFLDVQMRGMDGIMLGRALREQYPQLNIIYVTAHTEHAFDAYQINASGYLLKPIDPAELRRQLECLRYPLSTGKRMRIRCFGNFDVFVDGQRLNFKYERSREVFDHLVDRCGASCSMDEIQAALWEDEKHSSYLQNLRKDMLDVLKSVGCEDVVERKRGQMALKMELVDCDFYDWKKGNRSAGQGYQGEYMSQYSWAEETNARIAQLVNWNWE